MNVVYTFKRPPPMRAPVGAALDISRLPVDVKEPFVSSSMMAGSSSEEDLRVTNTVLRRLRTFASADMLLALFKETITISSWATLTIIENRKKTYMVI